MKSQTKFKTIKLAATLETTVAATGSSFFVDSVDGDCFVALDDGAEFRVISGSFFECEPGDYFTRIRFRNGIGTGGATITIRFYAGTLRVGNRTPVVYTRPAPTYMVADVETVTAGAPYAVPNTNTRTGQTIADKQVRVRIENRSVTNNVHILVGGVIAVKLPAAGASTGFPFEWIETSDQISIDTNATTSEVALMIIYDLPA